MTIFVRGKRKSLFLSSTFLRGRVCKDDNEQGGATNDGIEVGSGFADAADKMSGDDNRPPEQRGKGATQDVADDAGNGGEGGEGSDGAVGGAAREDDRSPDNQPDDENTDDEGKSPDGGEDDGEDDGRPPKRKTAQYIRDLKRENRELKRDYQTLEQRIAAMENRGSTTPSGDDNSTDTSKAPDANDATKYPLGVFDDGYINDMIEWQADRKVQEALNGRVQAEKDQAETERQRQHVAELRGKADLLTQSGLDQFDDFESKVVEGGLKGEWKLTEETFLAAADADNGPAILYALANDKTEAERVSKLSPFQQVKYVADKDAELTAAKPAPRKIPRAGTPPPRNAPTGRNASHEIRADTENLNDFRKLYYKES